MSYVPEFEVEIVDAINVSNGLSMTIEDIAIDKPTSADAQVKVVVRPEGDNYHGKANLFYHRRELAKFFTAVPLIAIVDGLGKIFSGLDVINVLNKQYGSVIFNPEDFDKDDLEHKFLLGEFKTESSIFHVLTTSPCWVGEMGVTLFQRLINLDYIIDKTDVVLETPPDSILRSYYADFTPYANILRRVVKADAVDSNLGYLINLGLDDINVVGATVVYNGSTLDATHKVNSDYTNVLIVKPLNSSDAELAYIHYNTDSIPDNVLATESGEMMSDESGNLLITE